MGIMTRYTNTASHGLLASVEFSPMQTGNMAFLHLRDAGSLEQVKARLPALGQEVLAQTMVKGAPMLVTRGAKSPSDIVALLEKDGERLTLHTPKKPFDAWKIRSILGFGGQTLQLISSFLRPSRQIDPSVFMFAVTNLAANTINLIYRGQEVDDPHRLNYVKQELNTKLAPHLAEGQAPPSVHDHRSALRGEVRNDKALSGFQNFMQKHSVNVGELGLRYLGAIGLAYPAPHWKASFKAGEMPPRDPSNLRFYAGLSSVVGKTIALASKIPDPYDPKPKGWLNTLREKFTFLAGGLVEITSYSAFAYECFFNTTGKNARRGIRLNGHLQRDWIGGIGASMFVLGYITRSWAKYGQRHVNMEELYAHASDTIAKLPAEKVPQLLADTAAAMTEHFKDTPNLDYATIYSNLAADLYRYHHIAPKAVSQPIAAADSAATTPAVNGHAARVQAEASKPRDLAAFIA